jgi:hypothetical protein
MGIRSLALLLLVILPGLASSGVRAYCLLPDWLLPDWIALTASAKQYRQLAASPTSTLKDLAIAEAAETRHRINCFAEGIGVVLGLAIVAIGIHGLCTMPKQTS